MADLAAAQTNTALPQDDASLAIYRFPQDLAAGANDKWVLFRLINRLSVVQGITNTIGGAAQAGMNNLVGGAFTSILRAMGVNIPNPHLTNAPETLTTIITHLPASAMKTNYAVGYEELSLGSTVGTLIQNLEPEKMAAISQQLSNPSIMSILQKVGGGTFDLLINEARDSGGKALETLGFNNATEMIDRVTRSTINQRVEVLFKNVKFRTHTFTYQFMPRSASEAEELRSILSVFKLGMLPSYEASQSQAAVTALNGIIKATGSSLGFPDAPQLNATDTGFADMTFGFPHEWEIVFSPNHAKNTFQIMNSVLEEMDVDHAASGQVAFFKDGNPVSTSVTLRFRETVLLTRDQYSQQLKANHLVDTVNPSRRTYRF